MRWGSSKVKGGSTRNDKVFLRSLRRSGNVVDKGYRGVVLPERNLLSWVGELCDIREWDTVKKVSGLQMDYNLNKKKKIISASE